MNKWIGLGAAIGAYVIWQWQELKQFRVTRYEIKTNKRQGDARLAVISDLHSFSYGKGNKRLIQAVKDERPDLILVAGDLIVARKPELYPVSLRFMEAMARLAPVYVSNGNHESRAASGEDAVQRAYAAYQRRLEEIGVYFLNNCGIITEVKGEPLGINGVEIPLACYRKSGKPYLEPDYLERMLGKCGEAYFEVLLAHNPAFAEQYARWGADLTLCGHNHGGLVSLPKIGSVISPQLELFPKYDAGEFDLDGKKVIISRGLGTHTFHVRICNRAELVMVLLRGASK